MVYRPNINGNAQLMNIYSNHQWCHQTLVCCAVSQFRGCILWRTRPLWSSKVSPSERPSKAPSTVVKWDGLAFGAFPGCITRLLCLNSGSASFRGRIWRPIMSQCCTKAVPIRRLVQMQPTNAATFALFLVDAPLRSFVVSHIPRFTAHPKRRKKERKWRHHVA